MHDIGGPRDGLAFLIGQIEREPRWLRYNNQDGWQQHGWMMAQWRSEVKALGDLEPRLLRIVLDELRRDLQTRQSRNNALYHRNNVNGVGEYEDCSLYETVDPRNAGDIVTADPFDWFELSLEYNISEGGTRGATS